ncbi:hypothetical protein LWI28_000556 [Acer negundo]|uniref:Uncharacterized protein n=1 Tax=Acer negundo TaxID=4023 RepID=A0AAD5JUW0_ACENE|nr:hypothetical protein LWI28_000556 [Acer negundo]
MIYLTDQETLVIEETVREGDSSRVTGVGGAKIGDNGGEECGIGGDGVEKEISPAQLAPNSYHILICIWHMWHRMNLPPPLPLHEIRHFYTSRQLGQTGAYFLLSDKHDHWIPKGVKVTREVQVAIDDKMKSFVWGFSSSNKFWKISSFFVGGGWGRSIDFNLDGIRVTPKVPQYFCSPVVWNQTASAFTDGELANLARAIVCSLEKRGMPYIFDEEKMIKARLFPRISTGHRCHESSFFLFSLYY